MLPPGLSFNAVSAKARAASRSARLPRAYWDWEDMLEANAGGFFPTTPSTNLLQGLQVALELLAAEGLPAVFRRHRQAAAATRRCVAHWGFDIQPRRAAEASASLTAVRLPEGCSADRLRALILARSAVSLGNGLGSATSTGRRCWACWRRSKWAWARPASRIGAAAWNRPLRR
jgi:alanine-glyoxylate transaminase/serine-glyoxylate transaminase/serine-pyruvate transaminase